MIKICNNLTNHSLSIKTKLKATNEDDYESFSDWCDENLEENGFYEMDSLDNNFIIVIEDDESDWKENFNKVVGKIEEYLKNL